MDEAITQDLMHDEFCENDEQFVDANAWGNLFPFATNYPYINLVENHYTVGRQGDIILAPTCSYYISISKVHFEIKRDGEKVTLLDKSANGTFVDGIRVGKNKSVVMVNDCEISLCCKRNKAFIFKNLTEKQAPYPDEVKAKYAITRKLGSGAYGEVRLAFRNSDHAKVAVKIIDKKAFALPGKSLSIESEVNILRKLSHPCIIRLEDAIDTTDRLYIFMELVEGGELFDRVITIKQFKDAEAKVLFYQMVLAIKYLHDNNICHRDIKPENILLSCDENVTLIKVSDFGLSKFIDGNTVLRTLCGTPNYLAPEVLLCAGTIAYTPACDVWSLGVILFICLVGYPPFTEENTDISLRDQILGGKVTFPPHFWRNVTDNAVDLVKRMLVVDPTERISVGDILLHPWLQDQGMRDTVELLMHSGGHDDQSRISVTDNEHHVILSGEPIAKRKKM